MSAVSGHGAVLLSRELRQRLRALNTFRFTKQQCCCRQLSKSKWRAVPSGFLFLVQVMSSTVRKRLRLRLYLVQQFSLHAYITPRMLIRGRWQGAPPSLWFASPVFVRLWRTTKSRSTARRALAALGPQLRQLTATLSSWKRSEEPREPDGALAARVVGAFCETLPALLSRASVRLRSSEFLSRVWICISRGVQHTGVRCPKRYPYCSALPTKQLLVESFSNIQEAQSPTRSLHALTSHDKNTEATSPPRFAQLEFANSHSAARPRRNLCTRGPQAE